MVCELTVRLLFRNKAILEGALKANGLSHLPISADQFEDSASFSVSVPPDLAGAVNASYAVGVLALDASRSRSGSSVSVKRAYKNGSFSLKVDRKDGQSYFIDGAMKDGVPVARLNGRGPSGVNTEDERERLANALGPVIERHQGPHPHVHAHEHGPETRTKQ